MEGHMIFDTKHKLVRRAMQQRLSEHKDPDLEETIALVLEDHQALETVLMGLLSPQDIYRFNCFRVILAISTQQPAILYPHWERFTSMLGSANAYHRSIGMQVLVNLAGADREGRLEGIFAALFDLLDDDSLVTARQMAQTAGKIALARPDLRVRVTDRLLMIDQTHHTPQHKALIKADILQAFSEYYSQSDDKARMLAFAQTLADSKNPKTRKAAKDFIKLMAG
jgi:hypothetical protein